MGISSLTYQLIASIVIIFICFFIVSLNLLLGLSSVFLACLLLFILDRKLLITFFLTLYIFQNTFIAFIASFIDKFTFGVLHGLNFFVPAFIFLLLLLLKVRFSKTLLIYSLISLLILLIFLLFGLIVYKNIDPVVYFRLFSLPLIMLIIGSFFSQQIDFTFLAKYLRVVFYILCIGALMMFFLPKLYIFIMNDLDYFRLKMNDPLLTYPLLMEKISKSLLNLNFGDIRLIRHGSLIKHPISFGYIIAVLAFFLYDYFGKKGRYLLLGLLVMLLISSSKGVLILFVLGYFLTSFYSSSYNFSYLVGITASIVLLIIIAGIKTNNEHILGFIHGLTYLYRFPLGNGLGFSGNLSSNLTVSAFGSPLPDLGYWTRFQNGSESVFGVLFSSLGLFSLIYLLCFTFIIIRFFNSERFIELKSVYILVLLIFFQGVFQEEAFSPYALGFAMFIAGFNYSFNNNEGQLNVK